jgi:beta-lactamase superfamily II metal-dependent hydrolase
VTGVQTCALPIYKLAAGDTLEIGDVKVEVLWPTRERLDSLPKLASDPAMILLNNNSLVMRFDYGAKSALFPGDIYKSEEREIVKNVPAEKLDVDLLKVPHHGHDTSSCKEWIAATSPEVAVMMGNIVMTKVVYSRYWKIGCTAYATWMNGMVNIAVDGEDLTVTADDLTIDDYYAFT